MKKLFKRKKKSGSDAGSLASGRSASGYNVSPKKDLTKIHKAAFDNDIPKLKSLLKKGDVNQLDKENRTALHLACAQGNAEAVRVIVNHPHCNLNLCDNDRRSALMKCVQCQFQECLEVLIQKRADVNLSDINGNTALHLSAAIPSLDACCLLLDSSANVHEKNREGSTPLHIAAMTDGSGSVITNLLDDGAQVNAVDNSGKTPLMLAASRGHLETVKLLLERKADASLKDKKGWSADDYASMSGHHPISMIIFEYSQKQENQKGTKSSGSAGDNVYASASSSKGNLRQNTSATFLSKNMHDDDLSLSDDLSDLSDDKHSKSDDDNFIAEKPTLPKQSSSINVAEFLKQRQLSKNKTPGTLGDGKTGDDDDAESASQPGIKAEPEANSSKAGVENEENESSSESSEEETKIRDRGYDSNSRKGGQVSPAKPPLPIIRSSGSLNSSPAVKRAEDPKQESDEDDSPWDSEDEDAPQPPTKQSPSGMLSKPSKEMMAELGLTEDDVNDIYDKSTDESVDFSSHTAVSREEVLEKKTVDLTMYSTEKKPAKRLDDSDKEDVVSATSSSWDEEDAQTEESPTSLPPKTNVAGNYLAGSSLLKFDDEMSEEVSLTPQEKPSSSNLKAVGVLIDSEPEESSGWDSDQQGKVVPVAVETDKKAAKEDSSKQTNHSGSRHSDFSDDGSTESESSWEVENRNNRKVRQRESPLLSESTAEVDAAKRTQEKEQEEMMREEEGGFHEQAEIGKSSQKVTKKTLAMEAAAVVRKKEEERVKSEQELRKKRLEEEEETQLLATQDREKIEAALQEALAGSVGQSESDVSELDDSYAPEPLRRKMGDPRTSLLPIPTGGFSKGTKKKDPSGPHHFTNGNDPTTWTATETESEVDEDIVSNIPSSLRSSQLSASLLRSGERGELEREAAREKRKAIDAIEQLDYARRNIESLKDEVNGYKKKEVKWISTRDDLEATLRKLNFDHNRLEEQLQSTELDLKMTTERMTRMSEQLELEGGSRRKQEVTLRELRNELKLSEQNLKMLEEEKERIIKEKHEASLHERVSRDRDKIEREMHEEDTHKRQFEALEMLMQEKDQELIRAKAERDTFEESCERYKNELSKWHSQGDDQSNLLGKLNEELNEKVQELTCDLKESEEALQQAALQYNMKLNLYKQANDALATQIKKEQTDKEAAVRDLEVFNEQQVMLKKRIEETEERCRRDENKISSLEGELKGLREKRESVERQLHSSEVSDTLNQQEANGLRTTLAHKESLLTQLQQDKEEAREKLRSAESELNEFRRENARLLGRVEMLQADASQQDSERMRLRRELEETRTFGNSSMTAQQGKLAEMMTDHQNERLELEKANAQLNQQVAHWRETVERINEEKLKKDEELALAQQDRIETHKHLSFTESSMAQLTESQRQLQEDKQRISSELDVSRARCQSFENRAEETNRQLSSLRNELEQEKQASSAARRELQTIELNRSRDRDGMQRLEDRLKEVELAKERLQSELSSTSNREKDAKEDQTLLARSQMQLESLVASLQDEKVSAEEKMRSEAHRCRVLQSEVNGHRQMWESEVKARSKLSVELAKADKERSDALKLVEAYKEKLKRASVQSKSYRTKFENQKRRHSKLEERIEQYSQRLADSKRRSDTSESECESRLSHLTEQFDSERSRLDETIRQLQAQVSTLGRKLSDESCARSTAEQELKLVADSRKNDSSLSELEQERDELREKLRRARSQSKAPDPGKASAMINAEVNAKLDQVNSWLEERAVAQDALERLRFANEEKRVAEANRRAEELQRELNLLRARSPRPERIEDSLMRNEFQQMVREKIDLQEKLQKSKLDLEENKEKLNHERRKYQQLHMSAISGAIAGNIGSGLQPATTHAFMTSPRVTSLSPKRDDVMSSTPRKDLSQPVLAQLRNKLDTSIAIKLANGRSSVSPVNEGTGSNQRRPDEIGSSSRPASNEYLLIP